MKVDFLHPSFGRCPSATTGKFALECDRDRATMQAEIKRLSALVASLSGDLEQSKYWRNFWCAQAKELSEKIATGLEGSFGAGKDFEARIRADERAKYFLESAAHRIGWNDALEAVADKIRRLPRDDYSAPGMAEFVLLLKRGKP